jgi:hypothetical protein
MSATSKRRIGDADGHFGMTDLKIMQSALHSQHSKSHLLPNKIVHN